MEETNRATNTEEQLYELPRRQPTTLHLTNKHYYFNIYFKSIYATSLLLFITSFVLVSCESTTAAPPGGTNSTCPASCECIYASKLMDKHKKADLNACLGGHLETALVLKCKLNATSTNYGWPERIPIGTRAILLDDSNMGQAKLAKIASESWYKDIFYLSISNSELTHLETGGISMFHSLRCIDFNTNDIHSRTWGSGMVPTAELRTLDLSHNHIHRLNETSFTGMAELRSLVLSQNFVVTIKPFTFEDLDKLEYLDLTGNALSVAGLHTASLFGLTSLKHLAMGDNQIFETVPEVVGKGLYSSKLETLDLHGYTRLETLKKGAFKDLNCLRKLNLSGSGVSKIELGWLDLATHGQLEVLDISNNRLLHLEVHSFATTSPKDGDTLLNLPNLQWLSLSDSSSLETLDGAAFNFVPNLIFLFLQRCNISRMNVAANDPLNPNKMTIDTTMADLKAIWTFGNPLRCNCHVRALLEASLPTPRRKCETNPLRGTTDCGDDDVTADKTPLLLDPPTYVWKGEEFSVGNYYSTPCCWLENKEAKVEKDRWEKVPFARAHLEDLVCETDRITVFISIVLGPLAFAAAILVAFLCGFVRTLVRRFKLYHSGEYRVMDQKKGLEMRRNQSAGTGGGNSGNKEGAHEKSSASDHHQHHHQAKKLVHSNLQFSCHDRQQQQQHSNDQSPKHLHERTGRYSSRYGLDHHSDMDDENCLHERFRHGTNVVMNKLKTTSLSVPQHSHEMSRLADDDRSYPDMSTRP